VPQPTTQPHAPKLRYNYVKGVESGEPLQMTNTEDVHVTDIRVLWLSLSLRHPSRWTDISAMWRTQSSMMWRRVPLVRTEVSEESIVSIIRLKILSELGKWAVTSNWSMFSQRVQLLITANAVTSSPIFWHCGWRMPSSGMLGRVALVITDVSEKLSASIVRG
jgi:hypothetical protein